MMILGFTQRMHYVKSTDQLLVRVLLLSQS
jgi:hypothetical protein